MSTTITLTDAEEKIATQMAKTRSDSFKHGSYEDTAFGKSSFFVHLIGAKAEVAIASHYGISPDYTERLTGDKHDFAIENTTYDVKTTTYKPAWLQVRESKTESDYYIACYIEGVASKDVEIVGIVSRETLLNAPKINSPAGGNHKNYRLKKHQMNDPPVAL